MSFFCSNFAAIFVYIADMTNKIRYIACGLRHQFAVEVVSAKEQPYKTMDDKHIIIIRNNEKYSIDGKKL